MGSGLDAITNKYGLWMWGAQLNFGLISLWLDSKELDSSFGLVAQLTIWTVQYWLNC